MPVSIDSINYASLPIGQLSLPVIILDITGRATSPEDLYNFNDLQVYPAVQNLVSSFGFYFNAFTGPFPDMFNAPINNMYKPIVESWPVDGYYHVDVEGSSNGWQLIRRGMITPAEVSPGSGTVELVNYFDLELRYKGDLVFYGKPSSGFATLEMVPVVIYRDHDSGKMVTFEGAGTTGPYLAGLNEWYYAAPGNGAAPVVQIPPGLATLNVGYSGTFMKSEGTEVDPDDIVNESPAAGADPYWNAPDSEPGGGPGTYDYSGNPPGGAGTDPDPSLSATDAGFITIFNPSTAELQQLSAYLWSNNFDLNVFKKLFNDPMDLFIGLSILPVPIPNGGRIEVGIGLIHTGIYMTKAASQWVTLDCGSKKIPNYTKSYLDYDPYTSVELYLPFVGSRALKADEVMGRTLHITYKIDILSGACAVWVDADGVNLYTFMGQCALSVPVASGDWTNVINGVLSVVGGAAGGAVKGGVGGAIAGGVAAASSVAVSDGKISVERSGAISSAGGFRAPKKPYLVISSPNVCKPANQAAYEGYPLYITSKIGDMTGYTQVELTNLSNIPATGDELNEIKQLLLSGVIL